MKDLISQWTHCDLGDYTVISPKVSGFPAGQDGEAGLGATGDRLIQKLPSHISWTSGTPAGLSALPEMQNMGLFPSQKLLACPSDTLLRNQLVTGLVGPRPRRGERRLRGGLSPLVGDVVKPLHLHPVPHRAFPSIFLADTGCGCLWVCWPLS